jgi:hypothetical protein
MRWDGFRGVDKNVAWRILWNYALWIGFEKFLTFDCLLATGQRWIGKHNDGVGRSKYTVENTTGFTLAR